MRNLHTKLSMKRTAFVTFFVIALSGSGMLCIAQEEFCCERSIMFATVEMPAEQERNTSRFLDCAFCGGMNWSKHRFNCPLRLDWIDSHAREMLEEMINAMSTIAGVPPTPEDIESFKEFGELDYAFFGELTLDRIDTIFEGYWQEGYAGEPDREAGNALGDYTIKVKLVNTQFNEKVWEGNTSWNGRADGYPTVLQGRNTPNAVRDLGASMSPSIDKLIYDYERTPMNCTIQMDQEEVSAGEEIEIILTGITDDKGRQSRPWQRLVISLEQGEITNATKYVGEDKHWVVVAGEEGQVTLRYKAPRLCQKEKETITIYNSCMWGGARRPMDGTPPKKKLTSKSFDIVPSEPKDCSVTIDVRTEYPPYFLIEVTDIINEKDKPFPDNLLIAVKAEKGLIEKEKTYNGWHVYSTAGGRITKKIKYTPPQCAITDSDILSFAAVCENKDGTLNISPVKFTKKIYNPKCSDAIFTLTSEHLIEKTLNREQTLGNDLWINDNELRDERKGTITLTLKKHSVMELPIYPETWVYYMSNSRSFDSWDISYFEHRFEKRTAKTGGHIQTITEDANITDVKLETPDLPVMVIVAYDKNTKKAKRVMVQAGFVIGYNMNTLRITETESWNQDDHTTGSNDETKTKKARYSFEITGDPVNDPATGKKFPNGCLVSRGDGKTTFSGYGKLEETKEFPNDRYYDKVYDLKTSDWTLTVYE